MTISEAPTAADLTLGKDTASVTLAITDTTFDSEYALGSVTISGVPAGWSLSGDGAASIAGDTWTADPGDLGGLVLIAPASDEPETFTLSVTASETAAGPVTATATTSFAVTVSAVTAASAANAPTSVSDGGAGSITLTVSDAGGTTASEAVSLTTAIGSSSDQATSAATGGLSLVELQIKNDNSRGLQLEETNGGSDSFTLSGLAAATVDGSEGSSEAAASEGGTTPTVGIIGSAVEGSTLTASVITSGFTGTTDLVWQRYYSGSWWDIPIELSPYSSGEALTYVTTPTYVVREEDENVLGIRVEATFVDTSGNTVATVDSASIGPVLAAPATLSLSPITGSPIPGESLSVSGLVTSEDFTGAPILNWQRYYSGGWWDIPIELSPYSSGEALTYVTTPTYVVRSEDEDVLGIRVEASYVDNTGQTFTLDGAAVTISEAPVLTVANVTLGEEAASVALAITDTTFDTEYTLASVTIGGVPSGWSLSGDGATSITGSTWAADPDDLGGLVLVAPSSDEPETFTLSVTASETAAGPTGPVTATAATSFAATVSAVAEAPVFGTTTQWSGGEGESITLSGLSVTGKSDDTLSATLTGLAPGWTLVDAQSGLSFTAATITAIPVTDFGSLVMVAPTSPSLVITDVLTLTVSSSEVGATATASASEVLSVFATGSLSGADLSGANLANADLQNANLAGANLNGAILTDANLTGANLSLTTSGAAKLNGANLSNANLSGADLAGADLTNADLTDANLAGANLTGTTLTGATLTGANLPLQLSALGASSSGADVTGNVLDGFSGTIAINAFDDTTDQELASITISYSVANQTEAWSITNIAFAVGDTIAVTAEDGESAFYTVTGAVVAATPAGVAGSAIACFLRGTLIRTDRGEVAVEELAIGDMVVTFSGALRPIKWIGRRSYDGRFIAGNPTVLPICVEAGALADGVPARHLFLSPEHALFVDDVLVPARLLANGRTIRQVERMARVEYFHIELETHDVLFAESVPAESYVDCDNRLMFQNAGEFSRLYPDDDRPAWRFCATRLEEASAARTAIRIALLERAEECGYTLDRDPDLHLIVDGRAIWPESIEGDRYRFAIPAGGAAVQLASRSAVPAEVEAGSRDNRRLGVPVERIALFDAERSIEVWHGDPELSDGFHADEALQCWTDGRARLPEAWLRAFPDGAVLEVELTPTGLCYRVDRPLSGTGPDGRRARARRHR